LSPRGKVDGENARPLQDKPRVPSGFKEHRFHIEILGQAALDLEEKSFWVDYIELENPVEIEFGLDNIPETLTFPTKLERVASLLSMMQDFSVHNGVENPSNSTVQNTGCRQILPDQIKYVRGIDIPTVCETVRKAIFPFNQTLVAELVNLKISSAENDIVSLGESSATAALGYLVICLPTAHSDGELIINHCEESLVFNVDVHYASLQQDNKCVVGTADHTLLCAAFRSDTSHEIKTVAAGVCITLLYQLLSPVGTAIECFSIASHEETPGGTQPQPQIGPSALLSQVCEHKRTSALKRCAECAEESGSMKTDLGTVKKTKQSIADLSDKGAIRYAPFEHTSIRAKNFTQKLKEALASQDFFEHGGYVGFPCFHLYENEADLPKEDAANPTTCTSTLSLKGADALLYVAAARTGLPVSMMRIIYVDDCGDGLWLIVDKLPSTETAREELGAPALIKDSYFDVGVNLEALREAHHSSNKLSIEDVTWAVSLPGHRKGVIDGTKLIPKAKVLEAYVSDTDHFGRHARRGSVYAMCAIVLHIPNADTRQQIPESVFLDSAFAKTLAGFPKQKQEIKAQLKCEDWATKHRNMSLKELQVIATNLNLSVDGSVKVLREQISLEMARRRREHFKHTDVEKSQSRCFLM